MTLFYFVRHGETDFNANDNVYCGRSDVSLNDLGIKQSRAMAAQLEDIRFDHVYVSPLERAVQTASFVSDDFEVDERLLEIDFGNWEGLNKQQISKKYSENWNDWQTTTTGDVSAGETGETMIDAFERINDLIKALNNQHPDGKILVVAHNTIIRLLFTGLIQGRWSSYRSFKCGNTSISVLKYTKDDFEFITLNDNHHLKGVL